MRCAVLVLLVVLVGPTPAAPVPKHLMKEGEHPDLAALQGKWSLTDIGLNGTSLGPVILDQLEVTTEVRDNTVAITLSKLNARLSGTFKLDTNASPRRLTSTDMKETDLNGKPSATLAPEAFVMIYKIEGDTLVLAINTGDQKEAPKGFSGKDGETVASLTFTRAKK
ncbi:hypothetical protein VT84_31575 [Gemmata sp. SH-PL17]|uniref:TIGR03067 domain-containing protein n=1 Tax=Gemmata sp. SH-PL17 TaxID=1630693 RepID=UPI00078BEAD4|nr:TIGR03067 domain-containing protein [Gemmata sp. SH-PL17]AMV28977.1 hypothetical protein VT84_31575 [Gemmata sp. SH-PL17]